MKWTEEEIEFLREWYPTEGAKLCAEVLDRTTGSVRGRVCKLKLRSFASKQKTHAQYTSEVPSDYEVLGIYVNTMTKILHRHKVCGHEWSIAPNNILSLRGGCPRCKGKTHKQYITQVPVEYEVLEPYVNSKTKILHKHLVCGHEWLIKPNSILSGQGCPKCSSTGTKHYEIYTSELPKDIAVLGTYINAKTKILHKHKICGHEWSATPDSILSGTSCPACQYENANQLYFIYFKDLDLYKIGVTNNYKRRLKEFGHTPQLLTLKTYSTSQEAYKEEQHILKNVNLVNTGRLISGNTETFRFT